MLQCGKRDVALAFTHGGQQEKFGFASVKMVASLETSRAEHTAQTFSAVRWRCFWSGKATSEKKGRRAGGKIGEVLPLPLRSIYIHIFSLRNEKTTYKALLAEGLAARSVVLLCWMCLMGRVMAVSLSPDGSAKRSCRGPLIPLSLIHI